MLKPGSVHESGTGSVSCNHMADKLQAINCGSNIVEMKNKRQNASFLSFQLLNVVLEQLFNISAADPPTHP